MQELKAAFFHSFRNGALWEALPKEMRNLCPGLWLEDWRECWPCGVKVQVQCAEGSDPQHV